MQLRGIPVLGRGCRCGIPLWGLSTHPGCFPGTQQYTAEESGNVSVQCHYKIADYGDVSKAWCKKEEGETCNVLVTTSSEPPGGHSTAREGSVRIQDDTQQGIVTITMEQLQVQDSGVYWCALQESSGLSRMEEVTLNVSKGGYGSIGTRSEIPDSCPCSLPLHCPAYPTSHLACVCLQQLPYTWTFSPPPPSLHCYLKREVKLLIIQLPQTDLSKRRCVFCLEFAPCVWVLRNMWYLGSSLSTLFLQLPATGRRKECQSLNLDAFGWFIPGL